MLADSMSMRHREGMIKMSVDKESCLSCDVAVYLGGLGCSVPSVWSIHSFVLVVVS